MKRAGDEVVQLCISHLDSSVKRPIKELRGFQRITLQQGGTKAVRMPLKCNELPSWDSAAHRFVVEPGKINVMVDAPAQT